MLSFVEAVSLAGDRAKQNDDAAGAAGAFAWVIDGATDLHDAPLAPAPSDASWIAQKLNAFLTREAERATPTEAAMRGLFRDAADEARAQFDAFASAPFAAWQSPTASALIIGETQDGVIGLDLGDCRLAALGADGAAYLAGGPRNAADAEMQMARDAAKAAGQTPLLRHADTIALLREKRALHNTPEGYWVFGLQGVCADHARLWTLALKRPAHLLMMSDGFSALADRYGAYDSGGLLEAALAKGLQDLGRELRAIEAEDSQGARHPRWKSSDDATALLMRLV